VQLNLGYIQEQIINTLIKGDLSTIKRVEGDDYLCLEFSSNIQSVAGLIGHFHPIPKYYFKNKDRDAEFLALGSWKKFTSLYEFDEIDSTVKNNPAIKIVGAQKFQQEECSIEWHGIGDCLFYIPQILIEKNDSQVFVKVILPNDYESDENKRKEYLHTLATTLDPNAFCFKEHNNFQIGSAESPSFMEWDNIVKKSLNAISQKQLDKIVLSRKQIISYKRHICTSNVFREMYETLNQQSYCVYFKFSHQQTFMSFTPETLFKVKDNILKLDSLAGTRPRGNSGKADIELAKELLSDTKEMNEHRLVTDYISNKMNNLVNEVEINKLEGILKQKYVQHIHTTLEGSLKEEVKSFDLIKTFHPTPAVGGKPKEDALDLIKKLEPYQRGFYAAPIGYFSKESSEFAVAIRCALAHGEKLHIFGGCGIVENSIPKNEWIETKNKMKNFHNILGGEF
jgi:menaquinone-specific isochorismate synthase